MFNLDLFPTEDIPSETLTDGKRYYHTPAGIFPSVTTVLKSRLDRSKLDKWRASVGEEEANKLSQQGRNRGKAVHSLCEAYLLGSEYKPKSEYSFKELKDTTNPLVQASSVNLGKFLQIKPYLDLYVQAIHGIEMALWSSSLRTAGRADLLAKWRIGKEYGCPAIIDFKTSRKEVDPKGDTALFYHLQATTYAMMAEERHHIPVPIGVIIIVSDYEKPQYIAFRNDQYRDKVKSIFRLTDTP